MFNPRLVLCGTVSGVILLALTILPSSARDSEMRQQVLNNRQIQRQQRIQPVLDNKGSAANFHHIIVGQDRPTVNASGANFHHIIAGDEPSVVLPPIVGPYPYPIPGTSTKRTTRRFLNRLSNSVNRNTIFSSQDVSDWRSTGGGGSRRLDLDLTSGSSDIVLGTKLFKEIETVKIIVGGEEREYGAGSRVTPGEYVAIKSVLAGKEQTLTLDAQGTATGGTFELNGILNPHVSELVVPEGVTGIDYFSSNHALGVRGDLINYGSIYGVSTDDRIRSGILFARDLINQGSGIISTVLPESIANLINNEASDVSLSLVAYNNLTNQGTISSSGSLTLATATGEIANTNPGTWVNPPHEPGMLYPAYVLWQPGPAPILSAAHDINIVSGTGTVTNSGNITATNGNVNISSNLPNTNVNVYGDWGTVSALNGAINIRNPLYTGTDAVTMYGGDYFAQSLNIYSGNGTISGSIGKVPAKITTVGDSTYFYTNQPQMVIIPNTSEPIDETPVLTNTVN